jgi:TRAP-type C4-dicarboxylate transport system substrate-binding protein
MEADSREFVLKAGVQQNEVNREAFRAAAKPIVESTLKDARLRKLYEEVRGAA